MGFYSLVVTIGQTIVMASLAEYASLWPTAGGQQFFAQVSNHMVLPLETRAHEIG